jgi:hypothetical protein
MNMMLMLYRKVLLGINERVLKGEMSVCQNAWVSCYFPFVLSAISLC